MRIACPSPPQLVRSLQQWNKLILSGPPREISLRCEKKCNVVIFTDGFTPESRKSEKGEDKVGAFMFDRTANPPFQFSEIIDKDISKRWLRRKTQIVPMG